ncbi:Probable pectinesterase/pectinesterase inhibitor 13 [Linum perenne]
MLKKLISSATLVPIIILITTCTRATAYLYTSSASASTINRICASTDYKQACYTSLRQVKKMTNDPEDFIKAAIFATTEAVKRSFNLSASLILHIKTREDDENNPLTRMALEDCKDLLGDAIFELQESLSLFQNENTTSSNNTENKGWRKKQHVISELQNWLSAVVSYQQTCLDQFGEEEKKNNPYRSILKVEIAKATQLTSNALAIVNQIDVDFRSTKGPLKRPIRKLLNDIHDFRLTWLSPKRRRVLGRHFDGSLQPDVVVAKDGSEEFKTISEALAAYKDPGKGLFVIYVKEGVYKEYITVGKKQRNVFMYGDGARKTIVTGDRSNKQGYRTLKTATFEALGSGFIAKSIGFKNTAGPEGYQAVALRVQGDKSAFIDCAINAYQDSLYCHAHRQFYHNCVISGTIDFIFGDASAVIQDSLIILRHPMPNQRNTIIAQGRAIKQQTTGIVIQNCRIGSEFGAPLSYLGRPWKPYSRAVVMESEIGGVIHPQGWMPWEGDLYLDTLSFSEYGNHGAGAGTSERVTWKGFAVISKNEAAQYTAAEFIQGVEWLMDVTTSVGFTD